MNSKTILFYDIIDIDGDNVRIGLDIDDTICNTNEVLMKYAYKYNLEHGNKPLLNSNTNDFSEVYGWNNDEVDKFFRTYYLDALKEIEPKKNVKVVLDKLKKEGHKIIFITVRNDRECGGKEEARRITTEWFKKYDIPYDELNFDVYDKAAFCKKHNIDVLMDDSIKTVNLVKKTGINVFLAINNFNSDFIDPKVVNIHDINEFYIKIHELNESR